MLMRPALLCLGFALFTGCGRDERCSLRPPPDADYGLCDLMMPHWAYVPEAGVCAATSGCSCDADCQANELPFSTREECEAVCMH